MSLIHNEQTKLLATGLNAAAGSCLTVGVFAPVAATFYSLGGGATLPLSTIVIGVVFWLGMAIVLHLGARRALRGLKE